jgi:ABC-type sugar transport system permease subunit
MIVPIVCAMYYSFFEWNGVGPMKFIGLANFQKLLGGGRMSRIFFNALGNNMKYLGCVLLIITPLQIFFAYILFIRIKAHRYLQFMLFLPYVISTSIVGFFAMMVFDPNIGLLNTIFGTLGISKSAWLGNPNLSFKLFVIVVIWACIGNGMMIFNANMKEIDESVLEAAIIDGCNERQKFFQVVLPQLHSSISTVITLSTIYALTMFDIPFMLGGVQGGVNNSIDFVNMVFYRYAFGGTYFGETSLGFGSSISVTMFLIILIVSLITRSILQRREKEV